MKFNLLIILGFILNLISNSISQAEEAEFEIEKLPTLSSPHAAKATQVEDKQDESIIIESRSPDAVSSTTVSSVNANKANVLGPGVEEKVYEGVTNLESATAARKKITDEAIQKVSEELVKGLLGEVRFKKSKSLIQDKILRSSSRFIPVVKTSDLVKTPEGQKMTVTLQISRRVLEGMLQENSLLYENEMSPMLLPFITVDDQTKGVSYRWWAQQRPPHLKNIYEFVESQLQEVLFKKGFYVQKPESAQYQLLIPRALEQSELSQDQMQFLATKWNFPLVLNGTLGIKKNSKDEVVLELQLSVLQVGSGRVLAQLLRQVTLSSGESLENLNTRKSLSFTVQAIEDLSLQMTEAWQRGVLSSTLVKLEVQGPLPLNKYDLFKDSLKSANRSIRQVRERLISSQGVQFELEINGSLNDVASSLKQVSVGDRQYHLKGVDSNNKIILAP